MTVWRGPRGSAPDRHLPAPGEIEYNGQAMKESDITSMDWAHLRGANGATTDAASSLCALFEGDEKARARAHEALRDELVPAWKWCAAGAAATPIFLELAGTEGHPARSRALILLTDLLAGDHVVRSIEGIDMQRPEERKRYARGHARSIYEVILAAGDSLLGGLDSKDSRVRSCTGFLLAFLSELAPRSRKPIERAVASEREPWAQASLLMSLALVSRYDRIPLTASSLPEISGSTRLFPWLAELYAEPEPHELTPEELGPERRRAILDVLRLGEPPVELFPWQRGSLERLIGWQLAERGTQAQLFCASSFAELAAELGPGRARCALEALRLCFEENTQTPVVLSELDEAHRAIVATLSKHDYPGVAFASFGLPPLAADRLRWLGVAPKSVLDREFDGVPLWRLVADRQGTPTPETAEQCRATARAEVDSRLHGTDLLEALALMASGAYGLRHSAKAADLVPIVEELGSGASEWARAKLPS